MVINNLQLTIEELDHIREVHIVVNDDLSLMS